MDRPQTTFLPVPDAASVERLFSQEETEPFALFIHDQSCVISAHALREVSSLGGPVHLVVTGDGQHLSAHVEALTGVQHESPQAFVIVAGNVTWTASHFRIRIGPMAEAMRIAQQGRLRRERSDDAR